LPVLGPRQVLSCPPLLASPLRRLVDVQKNSLVDERGLVLSYDLDFDLSGDLRSLGPWLDCDHTRPRVNLGPCRDGRDEAQLVRAVVDEAAETGDIPLSRNLEGRY